MLIWMLLVLWAFPRAYVFGLKLHDTPTLKILLGNLIAADSPGCLSPEG